MARITTEISGNFYCHRLFGCFACMEGKQMTAVNMGNF